MVLVRIFLIRLIELSQINLLIFILDFSFTSFHIPMKRSSMSFRLNICLYSVFKVLIRFSASGLEKTRTSDLTLIRRAL